MIKKILHITLWFAASIAFGFVIFYANKFHDEAICQSVEITLSSDYGETIISKQNIEKIIYSKYDSLAGLQNKNINTELLEKTLKQNPYIQDADVYISLSSTLEIKIKPFSPLVRIINTGRQDFYIDRKGNLLPVNPKHPARVIIVSGHIKNIPDNDLLTNNVNIYNSKNLKNFKDIFILANYIDKQVFLNAQIDQIYINTKQEYEITPKIGEQIIIFGDIFGYKNKFEKLEAFYKQAIRNNGWKYKQINLKYKNQIVCSKI
ncbi:MAG: hypothetical protein U9R32_01560 [Bacteroidota bacterium]|nr:hypothetical protein [Bacteroidota bacterium]